MPTVGLFHGFYFNHSDTAVTPTPIGRGGYPAWQASVITPSLFGAIGAWWDVRWQQIRWWWSFGRRVHRLERERRAVLLHALGALESHAYPAAQMAVRETATTLGFNRPEAWKELSRSLKDDPGRAENTFRHLRAMQRLRETASSTLTNHQQNVLTELAYTGFALMGR